MTRTERRNLKFFNTRTRAIESFNPKDPENVTLYCCGPTVYNYAHIGNLRTYFFEDTLRRTIEAAGYQVKHVMNITDVGHLQSDADEGDDKMALASKREQKSPWDIAKFYEAEFFRHAEALNLLRPHLVCRATEHIQQMIDMVKVLEEKGHAYSSGGNVYFDVSTFPRYTELARLEMDEQQATERVEVDSRKRNQADFVLWFSESKYPNQIMKWDSPWGVGFPGWHIECSAMASHHLGEHLDIHCGGIDHIPVHHTNEVAQSECCFGHRWVDLWMHGAFLTIDKGKMSKSTGNFLHLDRLVEEGISPLEYRYLMLSAHYRSELKFSYESLESARGALNTLKNLVEEWQYQIQHAEQADPTDSDKAAQYREEFWNHLSDDLHLPKALSTAWSVARDKSLNAHDKAALLLEFDQIFGLSLAEKQEKTLTPEMEALIQQRQDARTNKDWAKADELRDALLALGVAIKDRRDGTDWEFVTPTESKN